MTWLGLALILLAAFLYTSTTKYPGYPVAVPVGGSALIVAGGSAQPKWGAESVLSLRPFQLLGLLSYSWYLWHWPILTLAAQSQGKTNLPWPQGLLWVLLALLPAIATYRLIENPVRHSSWLMGRRGITFGIGACLVVSGLGVSTLTRWHEDRVSATVDILGGAQGAPCPLPSGNVVEALRSLYASRSGHVTARPSRSPQLRMLVIGDSTGCSLLPGLQAVSPSFGVHVFDASILGCGVVSDQFSPVYYYGVNLNEYSKKCQRDSELAEARAMKADKPNVILWASQVEAGTLETDSGANPLEAPAGSPKWTSTLSQRMEGRIRQLVSDGATLVFLLQPAPVDKGLASEHAAEKLVALERSVASSTHARTVNISDRVCPGGPPCPSTVDGTALRPDGSHYSAIGSLWVAEWMMPRILTAIAR